MVRAGDETGVAPAPAQVCRRAQVNSVMNSSDVIGSENIGKS
jgi:hypothetical protein